MSTAAGADLPDDEIFLAELEEIRRRRSRLGLDTRALNATIRPFDRGVRGLAFSGGGVRAACVALGVTQALARERRLAGIDYLSTVSGGGYLGGALSSLLGGADPGPAGIDGDDFPFRLGVGESEPEPLLQLRSHADFLAPGGVVGRLRLAAVLIRGVVLNVFLFLPWIIAAVVATEIIFEVEARIGLWNLTDSVASWLLGVALALVFTFPLVFRLGRRWFTWTRRNSYELVFAGALAASLAVFALLPFTRLTRAIVVASWPEFRADLARRVAALDSAPVWATVIAAGLLWALLRSRYAWIAAINALVGRVALALLGPTLLIGAYFFFCLRFVHLPFATVHVARQHAAATRDSLKAGVLPGQVREAVDRQLDQEGGRLSRRATATSSPDSNAFWIRDSVTHARFGPDWLFGATNGPRGDGNLALFPLLLTPDSTGEMVTVTLRTYPERRDFLVLALLLALMVINGRIVDANVTSLHEFYRDRLSRAFLLKRDGDAVGPNDTQRLSELNPGGLAPYHLINATVNVSGSTNPLIRGRGADFFLFSKYFTGSRCTGYCPTALLERADPGVDLASAMAISGAAAGPRMGVDTDGALAGDMALFNLRLGYWLANPARVAAGTRGFQFRGPGPGYLLREWFGVLHERGLYVNVTDGGHIENLGIYELLRRRCRTIVAVDAASDPDFTCDAIATLIRYARIDLGVEIDIDLEPLRPDAGGVSRQHFATGTIYYDGDARDVGRLVYLKASLTGDENEYIDVFRRQQPAFPNQSTADQFFNEVDFEVYRALGDHIATMAIGDAGATGDLLRELAVGATATTA